MLSNNSHKTAIKRSDISAPARYLLDNDYIDGKILDFGCGHGKDAEVLGADKYDPYFYPNWYGSKYDTVLCTYVLNVVEPSAVPYIIKIIGDLLEPDGVAYIAVRRDLKQEGETSKGTLQYNVELDLPVLYEKPGSFCIYELSR